MNLKSTIYSSITLTILITTLAYTSISSVFADTGSDPKPPLSVIKTDNTDLAKPGEILTYTITLTNSAATEVTVKVVDHLPNYLMPLATSPQSEANSDARTITWEQITIPESQSITLGLQAQIVDNIPDKHVIENRAEITGENINLNVTDRTTVEVGALTTPTPASPINPSAPTGPSHIIFAISVIAIISGSLGIRKLVTSPA